MKGSGGRRDDDAAESPLPFAEGLDAGLVPKGQMDDAAVAGVHGPAGNPLPRPGGLFRQAKGHLPELLGRALPITLGVQDDPNPLMGRPVYDPVHQILQGVQGLAAPADEEAGLLAGDLQARFAVQEPRVYRHLETHPGKQAFQRLARRVQPIGAVAIMDAQADRGASQDPQKPLPGVNGLDINIGFLQPELGQPLGQRVLSGFAFNFDRAQPLASEGNPPQFFPALAFEFLAFVFCVLAFALEGLGFSAVAFGRGGEGARSTGAALGCLPRRNVKYC